MNITLEEALAALRELHDAVEARADIGKHREKTVSPRMEDALRDAKALLERATSAKA